RGRSIRAKPTENERISSSRQGFALTGSPVRSTLASSAPLGTNMKHRLFFLLLFACGASACGDTPNLDAGPPDAGPPLMPSELFGPCQEDWQCPGEGAICRRATDGWPGGYCTVPCEDRTPCDFNGVYHHCVTRAGE